MDLNIFLNTIESLINMHGKCSPAVYMAALNSFIDNFVSYHVKDSGQAEEIKEELGLLYQFEAFRKEYWTNKFYKYTGEPDIFLKEKFEDFYQDVISYKDLITIYNATRSDLIGEACENYLILIRDYYVPKVPYEDLELAIKTSEYTTDQKNSLFNFYKDAQSK